MAGGQTRPTPEEHEQGSVDYAVNAHARRTDPRPTSRRPEQDPGILTVKQGVVSVRDLSRHATQILRAVEELHRPVLVARHGRVVAALTPLNMRVLVDRILEDRTVQEAIRDAEEGLADKLKQTER